MQALGTCLLFYLKYPAEMDRLLADEPDTEGLDHADEVLEKVRRVGAAADYEAAEFMESCAFVVEEVLQSVAAVHRRRYGKQKIWGFRFRLGPKGTEIDDVWAGAYIDYQFARLIPWLYCRGSRESEDDIVRILGRGIKASAGTIELDRGTVALTQIPIPVPDQFQDEVATETLINQVRDAFAFLTEQHIAALAVIARSDA